MEKNKTDEMIVKRVLRGHTEDFSLLIEKYQQYIMSIGYKFFYNSDDASDFTQDVFIKAYEKLDTFRFKTPFKYWLMRIAYNYGINTKKKQKSSCDISEISIEDTGIAPEDNYTRNEINTTIEQAINQLPEAYRVCVHLYFFMNLSYKEISDITGITVNTIKSNVFRAKKILRDCLKGTVAEEYHEMC